VALKTSQKVQEKTQNLTKLVAETNLKPAQKEELTNTVTETQNQVLALILETTEKLISVLVIYKISYKIYKIILTFILKN